MDFHEKSAQQVTNNHWNRFVAVWFWRFGIRPRLVWNRSRRVSNAVLVITFQGESLKRPGVPKPENGVFLFGTACQFLRRCCCYNCPTPQGRRAGERGAAASLGDATYEETMPKKHTGRPAAQLSGPGRSSLILGAAETPRDLVEFLTPAQYGRIPRQAVATLKNYPPDLPSPGREPCNSTTSPAVSAGLVFVEDKGSWPHEGKSGWYLIFS
jgi:hypothetical protein